MELLREAGRLAFTVSGTGLVQVFNLAGLVLAEHQQVPWAAVRGAQVPEADSHRHRGQSRLAQEGCFNPWVLVALLAVAELAA